ncbi:unnamed protein product [Spodoptera exigua]|nr:unnamed protein product [Spodoptera exigua]
MFVLRVVGARMGAEHARARHWPRGVTEAAGCAGVPSPSPSVRGAARLPLRRSHRGDVAFDEGRGVPDPMPRRLPCDVRLIAYDEGNSTANEQTLLVVSNWCRPWTPATPKELRERCQPFRGLGVLAAACAVMYQAGLGEETRWFLMLTRFNQGILDVVQVVGLAVDGPPQCG